VNAVLPHSLLTDRHRQLAQMRADARGVSVEQQLADDAAEIPLRRLGGPADVGDLVAFLASERAAFVSGTMTQVDGGRYRGVL
jgi:3-oxoacyl-[acyl-carrier protein] reductase